MSSLVSCHLVNGIMDRIKTSGLCSLSEICLTSSSAVLSLNSHLKVLLGGIGDDFAQKLCEFSSVLRFFVSGFFPVQVRFTPAHERFHLALCSPGDVSQVWVLVLVNAGGEPFAVVQVQRRFAPEAVSHSLALAASLDTQGYSVNDIIHILMAEGGQV